MYFVVVVHLKNVGRIRIEKVHTNSRLYQNENQTHAKESRLKMCHLCMFTELANSRKNNYCRIFMLRAVLGFCLFRPNPDLSWPKSQFCLCLGIKVVFSKGQLISNGFLGFSILPKNERKISAPVG